MTVKPALFSHNALQKMSNEHRNTSQSYYRSLDRALATRYMSLVLEQRRRVAAIRAGTALPEPMRPRMEVCDEPDAHVVTAVFELPGLRKEEIGVHLTREGRLTISGERRAPPLLSNLDPSLPRYPVRELKYGRFERTVDIPAGLEVKDITASLSEGMLSISWPRVPPAASTSSVTARSPSSASPHAQAGPSH